MLDGSISALTDWTDAAALTVDEVNQRIPGVEILEPLGQGGMGVVFLGVADDNEEPVAVKVLAPGLSENEEIRRRFQREGEILASLDHPGIVPLRDSGEADGHLFIVMDYIEGCTLRKLPAGSPEETMRLGAALCEALDYAHRKGIVHRDIKPSNVLVESDTGCARIADFGLAKASQALPDATQLTSVDQALGTMRYMAPEQWEGGEVGPATDIYALGAILYERLTGSIPGGSFKAPSEVAALPRKYDAAIMKALAAQPADRFADAAAFREALLDALEPKTSNRTRALLGIPLLLLSAAAVWFGIQHVSQSRIVAPSIVPFAAPPVALGIDEGDGFGAKALWADGQRVVAGAPGTNDSPGYAVVYETVGQDNASMKLEQLVVLRHPKKELGSLFGDVVATDGHKVICGASSNRAGKGSAFIFDETDTGHWRTRQTLVPAVAREPGRYGFALALHENMLCITARGFDGPEGRGALYVLTRLDLDDNFGGGPGKQQEIPQPKVMASGSAYGGSVATDGSTIAVGCTRAGDGIRTATGSVYVYERGARGLWAVSQAALIPKAAKGGEEYGAAVQVNGDWLALAGKPDVPVVMYQKREGIWEEAQSLAPANSILFRDGLLYTGRPGVLEVFEHRDGWQLKKRIEGEGFGSSLAFCRGHILSGGHSAKGIFALPLAP